MRELLMTSSPHIRAEDNTRSIMGDVLIALTPALILSCYYFGFRSLLVTLVSVAASVGFEFLYCKLMKRESAIGDLSAVVTGVMLAFNLPVTVPFWIPVIGAFFAIVIVKQLFGGIGCNFVNPALAARVFLFSWPSLMNRWAQPVLNAGAYLGADAVTGATPLAALKTGALPDVSLRNMFLGFQGGCLGETSAVLLLAGGAYLLYRRVISLHIPASYLATVALIAFLFPKGGADRLDFMLYELLAGGLIFGAVFMATDYTTSPMTPAGQILYGVGCGLITVFLRYFGAYPEGVSFSILVMNLLVPFIDKATKLKKFGGGGVKHA